MDEEKEKLLRRIERLSDWQIKMIVLEFLLEASDKQFEDVEREVSSYERINRKVNEIYKK